MATLPRIGRVRITTGLGAWREWTATADAEETTAGQSVTVTWTVGVNGTTPPDPDTTAELRFYDSAGTLIRTVALAANTTPQTATFFFTANGQAGGGARSGTVEVAVYVRRVVAGTTVYEVESDATPSNAGTGNTATTDRGYIVGTTTAVASLSNVGYAGAKVEPAEYGESLFHRLVLGAAPFRSESLTLAIGSIVSAAVSSATATFDLAAQAVDERFPAAVTTQPTGVTVPNNAGFVTGRPWTTLAVTGASISVDPRLTASHHFQVDDNTFALVDHEPSNSMLSTESGFLATRLTAARGTGRNGITVTHTLTPTKPGTPAASSSVTATRDGQAGWSGFLDWVASKPGGIWTKTTDVTGPADIDADSHLIGGSASYVMRVADPAIVILSGGGSADKFRHFVAGATDFQVGLTALNIITTHRQAIDSDAGGPLAFVALLRLQDTGANAGLAEYLDAAFAWRPLPIGAVVDITYHRVSESRLGSGVYTRSWTAAQTADWGAYDIFVIAKARVDGTDYGNYIQAVAVGVFNDHAQEDAVTPADISAIANGVWDEATAEARAAGSYGAVVASRLDAAVSSRADAASVQVLTDRLTAARTSALDLLDAAVSSRADASTLATVQGLVDELEGRLSAARAALLDNLGRVDATVSSRATAADVTVTVEPSKGGVLL